MQQTGEHKKSSNLAQRILTALIAIPALLLLIIYVPNGYGLLGVGVIISMAALYEYFQLVLVHPTRPAAIITFALAALLWYGAYSFFEVQNSSQFRRETESLMADLPLAALLLTPVMSLALLFDPHTKRPLHTLGLLFIGLFYVIVPFILFYIAGFRMGDEPLRLLDLQYPQTSYEFHRPLGVLLLTWASDTGAYFAGRAFGKHKLWAKISPGKTWEGAAGGLLLAMGIALVLQYTWQTADVNWFAVAAVVMVFGLLGDLVESQFKRSVKVKDSGGILPGHGGLLDRFDGFLLAMPIVSAYLYWLSLHG